MAVVKNPDLSSVALKLKRGVTASGSPTFVTRNYPCKAASTDQDLYDVALAIAGLQTYPVDAVLRLDNAKLVAQ